MAIRQFPNPTFLPDKLKEAREGRGFTITHLAEEIGKTKQAVSQYERGEINPDFPIVRKIAEKLNFPFDFFYIQIGEPAKLLTGINFRRLSSANKTHRKMAALRIEWLWRIYDFLSAHVEWPRTGIEFRSEINFQELGHDPIAIAKYATDLRRKWGLSDGPIDNMIRLAESKGIIVGMFAIANTLDAFSTWMILDDLPQPLILLDQLKSRTVRMRFNIAHEIGHLMLHGSLNTEAKIQTHHKLIESQADLFASAFLLPKTTFLDSLPMNISIESLLKLKTTWRVSVQAMIMRLASLGRIDENKKTYLFKRLSSLGYNKHDPIDDFIPAEEPTMSKNSLALILGDSILKREFRKSVKLPQDSLREMTGLPDKLLEQLC